MSVVGHDGLVQHERTRRNIIFGERMEDELEARGLVLTGQHGLMGPMELHPRRQRNGGFLVGNYCTPQNIFWVYRRGKGFDGAKRGLLGKCV